MFNILECVTTILVYTHYIIKICSCLLLFFAAMVILNNSEIIRETLIKKWSDFAGRPHSYTGNLVLSTTQYVYLFKKTVYISYLICVSSCTSIVGDIVSSGGRTISLGDFSEEWKAHRRVAHSALQRCTTDSLHSVIENQAHHLCKV